MRYENRLDENDDVAQTWKKDEKEMSTGATNG